MTSFELFEILNLRTMSYNNMAWWLKSAGALNFAPSQEQCPVSL